ncbi:MAG: glycosyltransferase family 4 protein [Clostridia bacterium]|nr:glycosyltransferase family 4 protein [Clostridia bacterium]
MNILFLSISNIDLNKHSIYSDLLKKFSKNNCDIYVVSAAQRRSKEKTNLIVENNVHTLKVKTTNITKTNIIEKGITTLTIENRFKTEIKKYFKNVRFDLVLYPTPPITFTNVVEFVKKRDNAKAYLLLKDIFPQNAVDIGMMRKSGVMGILYKMFRKKEKKLYAVSDYIGCMSQANVDYVLKHNSEVPKEKVHICPNTIDVVDDFLSDERKLQIREKYGIPKDVKVFIYGGNLGKPQDIPFVIECLKANAGKKDRFFVICGTGTEYPKLKAFVETEKPSNVLLINGLPKAEYEEFVKAFDIGLIFLDKRFTIPNFPSRSLSYMNSKMPILACTDKNTDIGKVISENGFGWWCESDSTEKFTAAVDFAIKEDITAMGEKGYKYLCENYTSKNSYDIIMKNITESEKVKV